MQRHGTQVADSGGIVDAHGGLGNSGVGDALENDGNRPIAAVEVLWPNGSCAARAVARSITRSDQLRARFSLIFLRRQRCEDEEV